MGSAWELIISIDNFFFIQMLPCYGYYFVVTIARKFSGNRLKVTLGPQVAQIAHVNKTLPGFCSESNYM